MIHSSDLDSARLVSKVELKNIAKRTKPLNELAKVSLGAQAYNSSKHTKEQIKKRIFHSKKKLGKEYS